MFTGVAVSTAPVWLGALLGVIDQVALSDHSKPRADVPGFPVLYWKSLLATISNGELFMYTTAALAPVFYKAVATVGEETDTQKPFPGRWSHLVTVLLITIICSAIFGKVRGEQVGDSDIVVNLSLGLYLFSVLLLYAATVYHEDRLRVDVGREHREQAEGFLKGYGEHRR